MDINIFSQSGAACSVSTSNLPDSKIYVQMNETKDHNCELLQ